MVEITISPFGFFLLGVAATVIFEFFVVVVAGARSAWKSK